jgi:hypothetical protein
MFLGNQLNLIVPEEADMYKGYVALAGCLGPWLDENDQWGNTGNIVERVIEEIGASTASPGLPFTDEWVTDNLAREAAFQAGRIPEQHRAWR